MKIKLNKDTSFRNESTAPLWTRMISGLVDIAVVSLTLIVEIESAHATCQFDFADPDNKTGLQVTVTTERLMLKSVVEKDIPDLVQLFSDPVVMEKFGWGKPHDREAIEKKTRNIWIERWHKGDPRSRFSVFLKERPHPLIGSVLFDAGDCPGQAEISYLFFKEYWGKGYAYEAMAEVVNGYALELVKMKYDFSNGFLSFYDQLLTEITATVSPDNIGSWKILDQLGFSCAKPELPVLGEEEAIPHSGFYNLKMNIMRVDKLTGQAHHSGYIRTVGNKYGKIRWHFVRAVNHRTSRKNEDVE